MSQENPYFHEMTSAPVDSEVKNNTHQSPVTENSVEKQEQLTQAEIDVLRHYEWEGIIPPAAVSNDQS